MSIRSRAILIGLLGPAISGLGFVWLLLVAAFDGSPEPATFRFFIFSAPHLVIGTGIVVSAMCLPIALDVSVAEEEELEMPVFEPEEEEFAGIEDEPLPHPGAYRWSSK